MGLLHERAKLEIQFEKVNELHGEARKLTEQLADAERDLHQARVKETAETIRGLQQVLKLRREEEETLRRQAESAKESFGAMSRLQQREVKRALELGRQDPSKLRDTQLDALKSLDSQEARDILKKAYEARADRAGYADLNLRDDADLARAEKERKEAEDQLRQKVGDKQGEFEGQKIELVDSRQIALVLEKADEQIVQDLLQQAQEMLDDRFAKIQDDFLRALADSEQRQENERRSQALSRGAANRGGRNGRS